MNHIRLRAAKKEDLPTLLIFEQELIRSERPFDTTLRSGTFHYYDLEKMIESDDANVVVAELDDLLVGSGNVRIMNAKPYNTFERYAFLGFMYTVPEYRGRGINQRIIAALVGWAREKGLQEIRLQVYDDNLSAIRAYQKAGFVKKLVEMRIENPPGI